MPGFRAMHECVRDGEPAMLRACFVLLGGSVCGLGIAAAFGFYLLMYAPDLTPDF